MNKSILIIGGTGCISSAIVKEAIKYGISVTIINRGHRKELIPKGVSLIISDKADKHKIEAAIHNKQFTAVADFLCYDKQQVKESFELYSKHTNQYFFISTAQVYDYRKTKISHEDAPKVDCRWDYSINKWEAEEELRKISQNSTCKYTIIRPSITYGDTRIPYGITPPYGQHGTIIQRILHDKPIIRWNKGENLCNMMRVEDFARAFVTLIGHPAAVNEVFNICSEKAYSFNDVLDILSIKLNKEVRVFDISPDHYAKLLPERKGEIIAGRSTNCVSSISKYKKLFPEFKEEYTLTDGISKTVEAYESEDWMDGICWEFDGMTDAIITQSLKSNNELDKKYNLAFIDYLNQNNPEDRKTYYTAYNSRNWKARILKRISNNIHKLYNHTTRKFLKKIHSF